jgi:hydroxymethylpyrimidine pyrophosphatase-like HAD family hydrolase
VFVDRDGTLYDVEKKELNPKTLDIIKQFQSEGKEVTVRTLGDVAKVQALLDEANIPLKVKSKVEFKGGTVEIAVDDLPEEELFTIINVKAEKYIQV